MKEPSLNSHHIRPYPIKDDDAGSIVHFYWGVFSVLEDKPATPEPFFIVEI